MAGRFFTVAKTGSIGAMRLIRRYWYWIILLIIILPAIIGSLKTATETQNYAYPFIELGLYLSNADAIIYKDVQTLKTNPAELIGQTKPNNGLWNKAVYYWKVGKVAWKELGLVWLITFPFVLIYKIIRTRQTSEPAKNLTKTIIYGLIFILVINILLALYNLIGGNITYNLPEGATTEYKLWLILLTTMPFHGVISLIIYVIGII